MSYFSFAEICIGVSAFIICGFLSSLIVEIIKIILCCKNAFLFLPKHIYQNRRRFFGRRFAFALSKENPADRMICDFLAVIILFIAYILASYLYFDGIFRCVYFFPLLLSYFATKKYTLHPFRFISLRIANFLFVTLSLSLSPLAFFIVKLIVVIKLPFMVILSSLRLVVLCSLYKCRKNILMHRVKNMANQMLKDAVTKHSSFHG